MVDLAELEDELEHHYVSPVCRGISAFALKEVHMEASEAGKISLDGATDIIEAAGQDKLSDGAALDGFQASEPEGHGRVCAKAEGVGAVEE